MKPNDFVKMEAVLARSPNAVPLPLKVRMAEIITELKKRHLKPFGLFVILGWRTRWQKFAATPDASQDIFAGHNVHRRQDPNNPRFRSRPQNPERYQHVARTLLFDGAILIDRKGNVLNSGVMIEGLHPRAIATKLHSGKFSDLSARFGFKEKVHTRHLTAIAASYQFKGTTVITVSEESGTIHVFENGEIVYASPKRKR